ncbi:MAG: Stp1/IreP family PP2C-type Ser/Thr phosphatase [Clostridiales bacterium]|nr:Stp1/IreP family PP2C-type Ser/Thr phosphatase [Clostridiales bacterium]
MRCWGLTDRGAVRNENQDSFIIEKVLDVNGDEVCVCVVCDGMGGAKAGDVASSIAAQAFINHVKEGLRSGQPRRELIGNAVSFANESVLLKARESEEYSGMGTTIVAGIADNKNAVIVNIGDSRCYHVNKSGIRQVTKDHSLVEDMIDRGEILREEAWKHPNKNLITRVLGTDLGTRFDIFEVELARKDCLLFCTDGLSNIVNPQELLFEIIHGGQIETAAARMMKIALGRNAPDNVTVVVLAE